MCFNQTQTISNLITVLYQWPERRDTHRWSRSSSNFPLCNRNEKYSRLFQGTGSWNHVSTLVIAGAGLWCIFGPRPQFKIGPVLPQPHRTITITNWVSMVSICLCAEEEVLGEWLHALQKNRAIEQYKLADLIHRLCGGDRIWVTTLTDYLTPRVGRADAVDSPHYHKNKVRKCNGE